MYDWVLSKRPTDLVGLIKVHGPVIIVTLNPQVELVERCISFWKDVYLTDLSEEVLLSRNRKKVHETSTVHLNPTAARECRSNKTVRWPRPPLTLAIHFHFARPNASESRADRAKQKGGGAAVGDPARR
jgi:hypothetical protein